MRLQFVKTSDLKKKEEVKEKEGEGKKKRQSKRDPKKEERKEEEEKPSIYVKTVVISHPDIDHYGWLPRLFSQKKDHIDYLIFGGLPEQYDVSGRRRFHEWIEDRLSNGTRVYFPAIQFDPITSMSDILAKSEKCRKNEESYSPCIYANPANHLEYFFKKDKPVKFLGAEKDHLYQAFNFADGKEVRIYPLAINPSHFKDDGRILRYSLSGDSNTDSLVFKIEHGQSSALLTGDATGLTLEKIYHRYHYVPDFLNVNVLSAAHHGSANEDCNNSKLIDTTNPEYVLISNGCVHGHPAKRAYKNFKKSQRLKVVT